MLTAKEKQRHSGQRRAWPRSLFGEKAPPSLAAGVVCSVALAGSPLHRSLRLANKPLARVMHFQGEAHDYLMFD